MMDIHPIILAAIIGAIGAIVAAVITTFKRGIARGLLIGLTIGIAVGFVAGVIIYATSPSPISEEVPISEEIPLTAGWEVLEPGDGDTTIWDENLEFKASLQGGDDYVELFLDLRNVRLDQFPRNEDGTYNLTGAEIVTVVSSDQDFKGDRDHPNGAQFILKNAQWEKLTGRWLNITDAMMTQSGMEIFCDIPKHEIPEEVAGISLKFTIGSNSSATYEGSFFVHSVVIKK